MKVSQKQVVALSYSLEVEGKIADSAGEDAPLEYIHGTHMLLPAFEAAVEGKDPGDGFEFTLSPAEGYGEHNPAHCIDIPIQAFQVDGQLRTDLLQVGNVIPMLNGSGQVIQGTVKVVGAESVKMDFNHPMAGKTLHFTGKVLSVREATEKELTEGLHGEYMPRECHCKKGKGKGHCKGNEGECNCNGGKDGCDCDGSCS